MEKQCCSNKNTKPVRLMSLFDSLGPVMTGPSSSHTAGISRIGRMGRQFADGKFDAVDIHFYGALGHTYKGHCSDAAAVAGLIGLKEDSPELGNALNLASKQNISVRFVAETDSDKNPNTVDMRLKNGSEITKVVGISVGGGEILMTELDDLPLCLYGNEDVLLVESSQEIDEANLQKIMGSNLLRVHSVSANGRTLYTCFLLNPATPEQAAQAKSLTNVIRVFALDSIYDYKLRDSSPIFFSLSELLACCDSRKASIPEMAIAFEARRSGLDREAILDMSAKIWDTMVKSVETGVKGNNRLLAGFVPGNDGAKVMRLVEQGKNVSGRTMGLAVARAIATMELNGCMGCVAAAPTAGACGVMPGALYTVAEDLGSKNEEIYDALLTGAMVGVLIAMRAPVSGALGGCQSEIGVASAMTAASLTQLAGGSPKQVLHATAIAIKSILGLVCDPVAGPVEIPCIKRNGIGVGNAMAAADMALAGVESAIPPDEVIDALINVQKLLPKDLRGTLSGGLASTPTARKLKEDWDKKLAAGK